MRQNFKNQIHLKKKNVKNKMMGMQKKIKKFFKQEFSKKMKNKKQGLPNKKCMLERLKRNMKKMRKRKKN